MPIALSPSDANAWAGVMADVATVLALAIGGWWTYTQFIRERGGSARAYLDVTADHRSIGDDHLLRALVRLENRGSVLLHVNQVRCEIYQVAPPAGETLQRLQAPTSLIETSMLHDSGRIGLQFALRGSAPWQNRP